MKGGVSGMVDKLNSPCFVIEGNKLTANLEILQNIANSCGIFVLHSIKCFDEPLGLEIINKYLDGYSISNFKEYKTIEPSSHGYIHTYAPYFDETQIGRLSLLSDSISFNSLSQWERYSKDVSNICSAGIRVQPKLEIKQPKYCDASDKSSRFGVAQDEFLNYFSQDIGLLEGIHFHIFCYQDFPAFEVLIRHLKSKFHDVLEKMKWINLGGGIRLTDDNFDRDSFIVLMRQFKADYPNLDVYIEPGNAVVANCGYLMCSIVDIIDRDGIMIAIVDTSTEAHMLDIAITKVSPKIKESVSGKSTRTYTIAGISCSGTITSFLQ